MEIDKHKKQFGNLAGDYTKYRKEYPKELFDFIFTQVGTGGKKILDIACGTGKSTESLVRDGIRVFGCDIDPLMLAEAKKQAELKHLDITYSIAEAENLPYSDDEFDAVTVGTAFHWFANKSFINQVKRVLKKRGSFFVYWSLTVKDVPKEDGIPLSFLEKYKWQKVPKELRDLTYISNFLSTHEFERVSTHRIPVSKDYNVEEYVGLQKTASSYGVLSEEDKKSFDVELTEILTKQLGDRSHFTLEDEVQICCGFKK